MPSGPEDGTSCPPGACRISAAPQRRLAAILAADVVGYSRLVEQDEAGTLAAVRELRREALDPLLAEHRGRLVKSWATASSPSSAPPSTPWPARPPAAGGRAAGRGAAPSGGSCCGIGINLGDVVVEDDGDLLGDGVNVAARLEQLCEPGDVAISGTAYDHLQGKIDRRSSTSASTSSRTSRGRCASTGCARDAMPAGAADPDAARPAVDRRAPLREPERRPRAGLLRRRHGRGDHHRPVADALAVRDRPQLELHLQGPGGRREAGRARARRALRARRQRAQGGQRVRITGQLVDASTRRHICGPTASTASWRTSSTCRTG